MPTHSACTKVNELALDWVGLKVCPYCADDSGRMHDYRLTAQAEPKPNTLRLRLARVCAVLGITLVVIAIRFVNQDFLVSRVAERRPGTPYTRMWFDPTGTLVGVRIEPSKAGSNLTIERWSSESGETRQVDLAGLDASQVPSPVPANPAQWTVAHDLSRVVWVAGTTLRWVTLPSLLPMGVAPMGSGKSSATAPVSVSLPTDRDVLTLGILSDDSVAAVFSDGSVQRWDPSGHAFMPWRTQFGTADQAVVEDDYIALSSGQSGRLLLYHFLNPQVWTRVEEGAAPDPPYTLIVPAPGIMAEVTPAGVRLQGKTRPSPGAPRSTIVHAADVIASGDFEGVMVLPPDEEAYLLAQAAPGSLVAADSSHVAVSGPEGAFLLNLASESRLTTTGRRLLYTGVALLVLAPILALGRFLHNMLLRFSEVVMEQSPAELDVSSVLPEPPNDLVQGIATGKGVLWAGAGLSAQSGFPLRQTFVLTLLQLASKEHWADAPLLRTLTESYPSASRIRVEPTDRVNGSAAPTPDSALLRRLCPFHGPVAFA